MVIRNLQDLWTIQTCTHPRLVECIYFSYHFLCLIGEFLFSGITFVPDKDLGPEKCSGHLGFGGIPICGNFDNDAARRACWDLDINSFGPRGRRGYR